MADNAGKTQSSKTILIIGAIMAVVIIALLAVIIVMLTQKKESAEVEEKPRTVLVTEENAEAVVEEMHEQAEKESVTPGHYTVTMNTTWLFKSGDEPSYNAVVENVEANTNDVYFDVLLESDESVVLYQSPVIPRGSKMENIKLDKVLSAGTYPCVVVYNLVDENQNSLSTVRVGLTIKVEN